MSPAMSRRASSGDCPRPWLERSARSGHVRHVWSGRSEPAPTPFGGGAAEAGANRVVDDVEARGPEMVLVADDPGGKAVLEQPPTPPVAVVEVHRVHRLEP